MEGFKESVTFACYLAQQNTVIYTPNFLTYTLQTVTSDNMVMEEHIELIYNSIVCCSIWNYVIALVMQVGNSNSARLRLTQLQVSCLHYLRN